MSGANLKVLEESRLLIQRTNQMLESLSSQKDPKSPAPKPPLQLQHPQPLTPSRPRLGTAALVEEQNKSPRYSSLASTNKVINIGALMQT